MAEEMEGREDGLPVAGATDGTAPLLDLDGQAPGDGQGPITVPSVGEMLFPDFSQPPSLIRELLSPGETPEDLFTRTRLDREDIANINQALTLEELFRSGQVDVGAVVRRHMAMLISLAGEGRKEAIQWRSGVFFETRQGDFWTRWAAWRGKPNGKEKE